MITWKVHVIAFIPNVSNTMSLGLYLRAITTFFCDSPSVTFLKVEFGPEDAVTYQDHAKLPRSST